MSILSQLASSLNRRDEAPNIELAEQIVNDTDEKAIQECIALLDHKNKAIQNDCIKVLYEVGARKPSLISTYTDTFLGLLDHKNNRLQWGAMTALNSLTLEVSKAIYEALPKIIAAADKGSVITKDHAVNILIKLCSLETYTDDAFAILNAQLLLSPTNQLPMYAEKAIPIINTKNKIQFIQTVSSRLGEIEKETKRRRVENVIKKINKTT